MIKAFRISLFLMILLTEITAQESNLTVITLNLRLDHAGDGHDNWQYRRHKIRDYIIAESPDFLGVQEALYNQVAYLNEALTDYDYIGVGRDDGQNAGEFMAIFYKKDVWSYLDGTTFWLSTNPQEPSRGWDAACHRVCTYGIFANQEGDTIAINNTHLDHIGQKARANSVLQLVEHMQQWKNVLPAVLMGDFNFEPQSPLYAAIGEKLSDALLIADKTTTDHAGTFNGFELDRSPNRRIDYIWVEPQKILVKDYVHQEILTDDGRQMSDHFPVKCLLQLLPK